MKRDSDKTKEQLLADLTELRKKSKEQQDKLNASNQQLDADNQQLRATEQQLRAANQQLIASERELKLKDLVFESSIAANSIADNEGVITHCNIAFLKMWGYDSQNEILGKPISSFLKNEDETLKIVSSLNESGIWEGEYTGLKKDGSTFNAFSLATIVKNEKGENIGYYSAVIDISKQKQVEKAVASSEERLRILFESAPDAYYIMDLKGNFINGNKAAESILGYKTEELIGKNFAKLNLLSSKDLPKALAGLAMNVLGKSTGPDAFTLHRKDGVLVPLEIRTHPVKIDGKRVVLGIARDITVRKQAEKELIKLSTAVKQSPSVIIITDTNGNIEYVNPKFTEITGYSLEEVIWQNPRILKSGEQSDEMYEELWKTISSGKAWRGEFHNKKKNGELFWESASVSPIFDEKGKIINYIKVAEDITRQKRNEQIQSIIYNISNAVITGHSLENFLILVKEELGKLIDTTNFFVALYDEKTDRLSLPLHQDDKDRWKSHLTGKTLTNYVIKTGKSLLAKKAMIEKLIKSGEVELVGHLSEVWLGVPLKSDHKITGILAVQSYNNENAYDEADVKMLEIISHEISLSLERFKAEEDLKFALEKAQESDRLKSAFLANMSHEIRTPMNGILGFTELLKEPQLTGDERDQYIRIIEKSGDRMLNTINNIIDISKIESGLVEVVKTEVSVNKILEEQYNFFYQQANFKGLELNYKPSLTDSESRIVTDRYKLEGILINLLRNAIKFTATGEITFGCRLKDKADGKFIEFYVKDTGIGIPEDKVETIFNRFEQVDTGVTRVFEGSGLGLAISKSYVEMLGGEIGVSSKEGSGSTFTFSIPYNR